MALKNIKDIFQIDSHIKIGQVHLKVSDINKSIQFYESFFGFKIVKKTLQTVYLSYDGQLPYLLALSKTNVNSTNQRTAGLYHFAILLPQRKDLANFASHLLKHKDNVKIDRFSDHLVSEAIYIRDPDHIGIEIYRDREKSEWLWQDNKIRMTLDPLDMNGLLKESTQPWNGFPPNTMIGHLHLHVSNLEKAKIFYSEILGFNNTASMQGALFFAAGDYHHHIATNVWLGENILKANSDFPGLDYFTIKFSSKDTLNDLIKRLESHNITVSDLGDGSFSIFDDDKISIHLTIC
ncbi:Putative ring-cleavage extradiol dioxygenase [Candidatus Nitrosarchaeum limnium SFB1]|jgi:catechol 2,3-dioxygenase|uniref:Putative ring-cleavage extradiol dioxygenase n=1 Tax=Candidatus Nitrosarchaeum limnium SFB1 TaxID=886738 RepID=F3KLA6_9ARCH|nr:Putative ring-cleavage extradiol dioxygenase [Candidatus Nitrosarchaeum limnium SFB1]